VAETIDPRHERDDLAGRAVRGIRPYLPELLGDRATAMDTTLQQLLHDPDGTDDCIALLETDPATQAWLADFFETGLPPDIAPRLERGAGYAPLPGHGVPRGPQRYTCPVDRNYDWYRVEITDPVPDCRDHPGIRLVPA
jgi:hypothetical protein